MALISRYIYLKFRTKSKFDMVSEMIAHESELLKKFAIIIKYSFCSKKNIKGEIK